MTAIAQAFAKTNMKAVSYKEIAKLGVTYFKVSNLNEEIIKIETDKFFRRGSLPCGKGAVVNISVFGEPKYLRRIEKNTTFKAEAIITKKTIANGNVREFHNLDLHLINPSKITTCVVKVVQSVGRNESGKVYKNPQLGAIVCTEK